MSAPVETPRVAPPLFTVGPSAVEELTRVCAPGGPRLFIKRDDVLPVGFGGNKLRKLAYVVGDAIAHDADTLITCGGLQSNHARATAAVALKYGLKCLLVANGEPQSVPTGNARLAAIMGVPVHYVRTREERDPRMHELADEVRRRGGRPYVISLGASVPLGALGFDVAIDELLMQLPAPPDVLMSATASGGTQAGLIAGCFRRGLTTRVIGISADGSAASLGATVTDLLAGLDDIWHDGLHRARHARVEIDDAQVGQGYALPTAASQAATERLARAEGLFLDPVYTAKAFAGLLARLDDPSIAQASSVLFWHTGGLPGIFA